MYWNYSSVIFPSLFQQLRGNQKTKIERKIRLYTLAFQQMRISKAIVGVVKCFLKISLKG